MHQDVRRKLRPRKLVRLDEFIAQVKIQKLLANRENWLYIARKRKTRSVLTKVCCKFFAISRVMK